MNKRIKKKHALQEHVIFLSIITDRMMAIIEEQAKEIKELRSIVERNAQATNSRFDYLEKKVADKASKKSFFSRK